jgi:hypothetical protein
MAAQLYFTWIKAAFNNNATALWRPSWWESATAGHNFGREPSNDYFIKILFLLSKWFQKRRLKLLSQSQPNFAEMILGWSSSKNVSGISELRPIWSPQSNLI